MERMKRSWIKDVTSRIQRRGMEQILGGLRMNNKNVLVIWPGGLDWDLIHHATALSLSYIRYMRRRNTMIRGIMKDQHAKYDMEDHHHEQPLGPIRESAFVSEKLPKDSFLAPRSRGRIVPDLDFHQCLPTKSPWHTTTTTWPICMLVARGA